MNRAVTVVLALVIAVAGAMTGEFVSRIAATHRVLGRILGHGELITMVDDRGIFDGEDTAEQVLRISSAHMRPDPREIDRAMRALRGQFGDDRHFAAALRSDEIWKWQLREMVADVCRAEEWMEAKIAPALVTPATEAQNYFQTHQAEFVQPLRIGLRQVFLAAPTGNAAVQQKRAAMQEIVSRLQRGEDFSALAETISEDEASRTRGGDLGWVAANRVPAEFWSAIGNLPVNGPPAFVQSHLGFHAVQILEVRPSRVMSFEEARPEIEQLLADQKRRAAVEQIRAQLAQPVALARR